MNVSPSAPSLSALGLVPAALFLAAALPVQAVPYACNLTNSGTTISFRLNESADVVKIVSNGGATTNVLGARPAGVNVETLAITGPFQVLVSKAAPPGYRTAAAPGRATTLQISTDNNSLRFNNPRGLAVNTDPASPHFGRVYVSNSSTTNTPFARPVGDGIYVFASDLSDVLGQGDSALTGGLSFGASVSASPWRLSVGQDGNLYICDWSDVSGSVYMTDPDVVGGTNVLGGPAGSTFPVTASRIHGSIVAAIAQGSLDAGNLQIFAVDEDLQDDPAIATASMRQTLWRHDIGSSLPGPFVLPTKIALHPSTFLRTTSQTMDMTRGTNGLFYLSNNRSAGNESGVWVANDAGTILWLSLTESRSVTGNIATNDLLKATGSIDVSPDGSLLAAMNIETNGIWILPLLSNGLPDLTNRLVLAGFNTTTGQGREVAFDRAGNLYALSSGAGLMRVFSPGGTTTAITGSDGTFQLIRPPGVTVVTTTNLAREAGPIPGAFSIERQGDLSVDLTVFYTLTGTASNGVDYVTNILSAVIPAGAPGVEVLITPLSDGLAEFTERVTLTLLGSATYDLNTPVTASLDIVDDQQPCVIDVAATDATALERFAGTDGLRYVFTRRGDTNVELFVTVGASFGTATPNLDFQDLPGAIIFPQGAVTVTNDVLIVDDGDVEGNETVVVKVLPGFDPYVPGAPDTATGTIVDDDEAAAMVLFSDNFETDSSAAWTERYGSTNGVLDRTVQWSFDYSLLGVPPAPRSGGTTRGLYVTVNKDPSPVAAGINFYPNGQSFSGNYALRFDLYMNLGNSNQTEHALAGLNHSGTLTNWVSQNPAAHPSTRGNDGLFVAINGSGGNNGDYAAYTATNTGTVPGQLTNRAATAFTSIITAPPYTFAGSIGCASNSLTKTWAEVELRQVDGRVTLTVNDLVIYELTNSTPFASGNVLIGYNDQFSSRGSDLNFALFDNVRVVMLDFQIKSVTRLGGNQVQIDFVSPQGGGAPSDFRLQSAPALGSPGAFVDDPAAIITAIPGGWRAVTTGSGGERFYRLRR
ncbi:MAG: hypothetical protein RJA22_1600 [Verrucomicrobiota bacterium]